MIVLYCVISRPFQLALIAVIRINKYFAGIVKSQTTILKPGNVRLVVMCLRMAKNQKIVLIYPGPQTSRGQARTCTRLQPQQQRMLCYEQNHTDKRRQMTTIVWILRLEFKSLDSGVLGIFITTLIYCKPLLQVNRQVLQKETTATKILSYTDINVQPIA